MVNLKRWMAKVSERLAEKTGSISSSYDINTSITSVKKFGPLVFLTLYISLPAGTTIQSYGVVATIPYGYRPAKQTFGAASANTTLTPFDVTASGNVRLISGITTSTAIAVVLSAVYIVGGG